MTNLNTYILTHLHTDPFTNWPIYIWTLSRTDPITNWPIYKLTHLQTNPLIYWLIYIRIHLHADPFTYWLLFHNLGSRTDLVFVCYFNYFLQYWLTHSSSLSLYKHLFPAVSSHVFEDWFWNNEGQDNFIIRETHKKTFFTTAVLIIIH